MRAVDEMRTIAGQRLLAERLSIPKPEEAVLHYVQGLVREVFPARVLCYPHGRQRRAYRSGDGDAGGGKEEGMSGQGARLVRGEHTFRKTPRH